MNGINGVNGTQGPPGLNGTTGQTGITFLNGTNLYRVIAPDEEFSVAQPGDFSISSFAACDSGDFPLNGLSFHSNTIEGGNGTLLLTGTISNLTDTFNPSSLPNGYETIVLRPNQLDRVQSVVTCFDNPPLRP